MLQEVNSEELKELASIYNDKDIFVSIYLEIDRDIDWKFIEQREKQCKVVLKTDRYELENFEKSMKMVIDYLENDLKKETANKGYKSVALFFSKPLDFTKGFAFSQSIDNCMVVDTSPYIRPLAQMLDDWEDYALILMDNQKAEFLIVSLGAIKEQKQLGTHIINKHKKGGWSQMRFSRLRQEAIDQFQKKVVEAFQKFIDDEEITGIVLAGPGEAKIHFKKRLPKVIADKILNVIDYDLDRPTEEILEAATEEVIKQEKKEETQAVELLRGEILRGGKVVYGIKDTVAAAREGKAETVILSKELKPLGWKCEQCQVVELGMVSKCPYCDNETSDVDIVEEILEFAHRAGTNVEFVGDNPMLEDLGGVGAILRY